MLHARIAVLVAAFVAVNASAVQIMPEPRDADRAYRAAVGLLHRQLHEPALAEYRAFLEAFPGDERVAEAHYGAAVCLVALDRPSDALPHLDAALAAPAFSLAPDAAYLRAACLSDLGRHADAAAAAVSLVADHPGYARADHAAALAVECFARAGDDAAALSAADLLVQQFPESPLRPRADYHAAAALARRGQDRAAAERFADVRARLSADDPLAPLAALAEARARRRLDEPGEALALLRIAAAAPDAVVRAQALLARAQIERESARPTEALSSLDQLRRAGPDVTLALAADLERARVLIDLSRPEDAARVIASLDAAGDPALAPEIEFWAARCERLLSRPGAAAARLAAALDRYPDAPSASHLRLERAAALSEAGEHALALDEYERVAQAVRDRPDASLAADALAGRAAALHALARFDDAADASREFLRLHPSSARRAPVALILAESTLATGDHARAAELFAQFAGAHAGDPRAPHARLQQARCLARLGRSADAARLLEPLAALDEPAVAAPAAAELAALAFAAEDWPAAERWSARRLALDPAAVPPADRLRHALAVQRQGRTDDAARLFEPIARDASDPAVARHARFELAQCLLLAGDPGRAGAIFREIADAPGAATDELWLAATRHLAALDAAAGRPDDAQRRWAALAAAARSPADAAAATLERARLLLAAGRHDDALDALDSALEHLPPGPDADSALACRAIALARIDRRDDALHALDDLLSRDRTLPAELRDLARLERARLLEAAPDPASADAAVRAYADLLETSRDPRIEAFAALRLAERALGDPRHDDAATLAARAADAARDLPASDSAPIAARAAYVRAVCLAAASDHAGAAELLRAVVRDAADPALLRAARLQLGESLLRAGSPAPAADILSALLDDPESADLHRVALLLLGEAHAAAHRWPASEQAFQRFIDRFGPSDDAWFHAAFGAAWARENDGRLLPAIDAYRAVAERHDGPTAARAQFQIGECLFALSRHADALAEFLKVDILFPPSEWTAPALYEAARCLVALHRPDEAARQFSEVISRFPASHWAALAARELDSARPDALPGSAGGSAGPAPATPEAPTRSQPR